MIAGAVVLRGASTVEEGNSGVGGEATGLVRLGVTATPGALGSVSVPDSVPDSVMDSVVGGAGGSASTRGSAEESVGVLGVVSVTTFSGVSLADVAGGSTAVACCSLVSLESGTVVATGFSLSGGSEGNDGSEGAGAADSVARAGEGAAGLGSGTNATLGGWVCS